MTDVLDTAGAPHISGVIPVVSVPFTEDWRIDTPVLEREIDWILSLGADGVVTGMVSEILRLDLAMRMELAETVIRAVGNRGTSIISVGAESTASAIRLAEHARDHGASGVMVNAPLMSRADDDGLFEYFCEVSRACGDLPTIIQDASGYVGQPLSINLMVRLLNEFDPIKVQFKPEAAPLGPKMSALMTATQGKARVYEGSGGLALVESHRRGAVGTMPGPDLVWALVPLWNALLAGDSATADSISSRLAAILSHVSVLDSYVAVEKFLLVEQGIFTSARQLPPTSYTIDEHTRGEVLRLTNELKLAVGG